ncbi:DMT family transporter [Palleronia sediminis]|uniref:DMT family transporter n=1 Tax=Palleronia sediminis TaxID=2547833 RepID=A0A4R6A1W6_9RHOB|nr:DMT family transporter [Palleronia sediminis]TDL74996.1 DMT family transporter [Palleronia sediminis]
MSPNFAGALFMIAAMLGFAVEDALFKAAVVTVSPGLATIAFGLSGLVFFAGAALATGQPLFPRRWSRWLSVRTGFEIGGRLFFALALAFAPLAETSAILQAAPLVVTLGAALVLKEAVPPAQWVAMAIGFGGVLLILRPAGALFEPALLFAVLGMIGFAGRDLATRAIPRDIGTLQLGVLGFGVVVVAGLVIWAAEGLPVAAPGPRGLLLPMAGAVGVLGYAAITRAMRTGEVGVVAPFRYTRLLAALLIAAIVFGERPDWMTYAGSVLIVATGIYTLTTSGARRRAALARTERT